LSQHPVSCIERKPEGNYRRVKTNDCLRRLRYVLDLGENRMAALFAQGGEKVEADQITKWLKQDDDKGFEVCSDFLLAAFLNGLITSRRGKRDGPQPKPETRLANNLVLQKLKIAFDLKTEDILSLLAAEELTLSKHELSAFFRRPGHKHFRACKDQVLRKFLSGLQKHYRPTSPDT